MDTRRAVRHPARNRMTEQADAVCAAGCAEIEHARIVAEKELRFCQQRDDLLKGHLDE